MSDLTIAERYAGPERRLHWVFVTRHTEYHCHDRLCIAVRDVGSGEFVDRHDAIGRRLIGALRFEGESAHSLSFRTRPHVGDRLVFSSGTIDSNITTSELCDIERPSKKTVNQYRW